MKTVKYSAYLVLLLFLIAAGCGQLKQLDKNAELKITPEDATITKGETIQYKATAYSLTGQDSTSDITDKVFWVSTNTGVAVINQTGLATAMNPGITDITADFTIITNTGGVLDIYTLTAETTLIVNAPDAQAPICNSSDVPANNWTKHASNPLIDLGTTGAWDDTFVRKPNVLYNGTSYKMWYTGYDGTTYNTGYASSDDGINWTKHASNPVLERGTVGSWDNERAYHPSVLYNGSVYQMWYNGYDGTNVRLGYATSSDGINWTKHASNPVLDIGTSGSWDDLHVVAPVVIYNGSSYEMWFSGQKSGVNIIQSGYATSPDGINWTKYASNPVLTTDSWDNFRANASSVILCDSTYHMWYSGNDSSNYMVGYATSTDGKNWTKSGSPVVGLGSIGQWDDYLVRDPSVIFNGTGFEMWYAGHDNSNDRIGYAYSD